MSPEYHFHLTINARNLAEAEEKADPIRGISYVGMVETFHNEDPFKNADPSKKMATKPRQTGNENIDRRITRDWDQLHSLEAQYLLDEIKNLSFTQAFRRIRELAGISQSHYGRMIDLNEQSIGLFERGKIAKNGQSLLITLAKLALPIEVATQLANKSGIFGKELTPEELEHRLAPYN